MRGHSLRCLITIRQQPTKLYHLTGSGNNGPTKVDGHWTAVYVPEGGKLKIRMLTAVPDLSAQATAR
jgi:hypothetical protein